MRKPPFVRSPYNYDVEEASNEATIPAHLQGESLTVQSQAEDADLNVLMRRYGITGKFPENPRIPSFGDFSQVGDFRSAMHAVLDGQAAFMEYPAEFRGRFLNDPQRFMEWCADPASQDEMRKLGMLKPAPPGAAIVPPPATPVAAPPVPPPASS